MEKDKPDPLVGEIEELMMMTTASMQHGSWLVDALPLCEPYLRVDLIWQRNCVLVTGTSHDGTILLSARMERARCI